MRASLAILGLTLLSLSGCLDASVTHDAVAVWDRQQGYEICLNPHIHKIGPCTPSADWDGNELTPQKLIENWGAPQKDEDRKDLRVISYNTDVAWRGLTVWVIVPMPLYAPAGHHTITFFFRDERLIRIESTGGDSTMATFWK